MQPPPRNYGRSALPWRDSMLPVLDTPMKIRPAPIQRGSRKNEFSKEAASRYYSADRHGAMQFRRLKTRENLKRMMALSTSMAESDKQVLVEFWEDSRRGTASSSPAPPAETSGWHFWPGVAGKAGQGWTDDTNLHYDIEALALTAEKKTDDRLVRERGETLNVAKSRSVAMRRQLQLISESPEWALLSEEEKCDAEQLVLNAERILVPKRLHVVTARLQQSLGESRRQRLRSQGRSLELEKWHGVRVNGKFGQVSSLALPYHQISGNFAHACEHYLQSLKGLTELHLVGNALTGEIPHSINEMRGLRVLLLRKNHMRGRLPASLSDLRSLVALDLSDNAFSGAVPCLAELAKLQVLNVGGNRLGGPLSDSMDTCSGIRPLRLLSLERNRFSGFITCNFGEMTSLRVLSLADNELCGAIPQSLGKLTALTSVDFSFNRLSGAIPFRPKHQRALFQMNFMGNDDLLAPDRWLRAETPRFQMERTRAISQESGRPFTTTISRIRTAGGLCRSTMRQRTRLTPPSTTPSKSTKEFASSVGLPSWSKVAKSSSLIPLESEVATKAWPLPPDFQGYLQQELKSLDLS